MRKSIFKNLENYTKYREKAEAELESIFKIIKDYLPLPEQEWLDIEDAYSIFEQAGDGVSYIRCRGS